MDYNGGQTTRRGPNRWTVGVVQNTSEEPGELSQNGTAVKAEASGIYYNIIEKGLNVCLPSPLKRRDVRRQKFNFAHGCVLPVFNTWAY